MKYPQYTLGLVTGFCLAALYFMAPAILDSFKQPEAPQPVVEPVEKHGVDVAYAPDRLNFFTSILDKMVNPYV